MDAKLKEKRLDEERYGDVLIWFQILQHAKEQNKPVIFVSDDEKDDWLYKVNGQTLGPHYALVQEFCQQTNGLGFYLYTSDTFIDRASEFLYLAPLPEATSEAKDVRESLEEKRVVTFEDGNLKLTEVGVGSVRGIATFNYSNNDGKFSIGSPPFDFVTAWGKASNERIYCYNNPPHVTEVALAPKEMSLHQITDAALFDSSSRHRTPSIGQIVLLKNEIDCYAAIKILDIKDDTRGDDDDELTIQYWILPNGSRDFSAFILAVPARARDSNLFF